VQEAGYQLNKINKKIIDSIKQLLVVSDSIDSLVSKGSQESLDKLVGDIEKFDNIWDDNKALIVEVLKFISGQTDGEISVKETENGYEL